MNDKHYAYLFGEDSTGNTGEERSRSSRRVFVRGQDALAVFSEGCTGRILTAFEVYRAYGEEKIEEVMDYGSAILPVAVDEPSATLRRRRLSLGLSVEQLAKRIGLTVETINNIEDNRAVSPIREIEKVAVTLGLDERLLSTCPDANGDNNLAVRLKTIGQSDSLPGAAVMTFSEAAWVIMTQHRLQELFNSNSKKNNIAPDNDYGDAINPAWKKGFQLARLTREALQIGAAEPIDSMRTVCKMLCIPLILAKLPKRIIGATIESNGLRGIVVNEQQENVWVQRATIAHELGHLIWDPSDYLKEIKVDDGHSMASMFDRGADHIEARANAFAIGFIAPEESVYHEFNAAGQNHLIAIPAIMNKFGLSLSAAKAHICNVVGFNKIAGIEELSITPSDDWTGRERLTADYFPLANCSSMRRGEFSGLVVRAEIEGFISVDTAAEYLQSTTDDYNQHKEAILDIYGLTDKIVL